MSEIEGFPVSLYTNPTHLLNEPDLPSIGCLVIDYHMPDMTGLELLTELRSSGIELPAVLISGDLGLPIRQAAAAAGATVVEKPLLGNRLIEAIRDMLATRRS